MICFFFLVSEGSPRVEGDEDEEDIDDIEYEFNIEHEHDKQKHSAEAMLYGKMSYGRGPEDDENGRFPPVIAGGHSGEFPIGGGYGNGEHGLHKRVHPYPSSEAGESHGNVNLHIKLRTSLSDD